MPKVGVVIAAGGKGTRLGGRVPKQFLRLKGTSIIRRTLEAFEPLPFVREIVVVVPAGYVQKTRMLLIRSGCRKVSGVVEGGRTRQESVRHGLESFRHKPEIVLVHDAVRPLVTSRVIHEVVRQAQKHRAAVVGVPVKDTVKIERRRGFYAHTLDRGKLWAVQTPQGFQFEVLVRAHRKAKSEGFVGTDEASLVERMKVPVKIVRGDYRNIKITTSEDLQVAGALLRS